jgi:hypothetical protein
LRPEGWLLLVEDAQLPIGEKAHAKGFLVLTTSQLYTLFAFGPVEPEFRMSDARGDGRLLAHLIPASCLGRLTGTTLRHTLEAVQADAEQRIKALRAEPPSYPNGRRHALHVQLLANATLALHELGS